VSGSRGAGGHMIVGLVADAFVLVGFVVVFLLPTKRS
jgi:hypothetical protein